MIKGEPVIISVNGETSRDFRSGDVMHLQADIGKAQHLLGYEPTHSIEQGLDNALDWYIKNLA